MLLALAQNLPGQVDIGGVVVDQQDFSLGFDGRDRKISVLLSLPAR